MMASPLAASSSRASTPESPLARAATTIDDLIVALSNFSRAPTPDPAILCCCCKDNCESTLSWASFRAKLESRLVLSAEVGQALLQRHEAYVRRKDATHSREASLALDMDRFSSSSQQVEFLTRKLDAVTEENTLVEARINELLIKHEMSEASNRAIMRELQESRAALHRLSAQHTRSIGWEMRLAQQTQEKEDMRQERDSESHRAKLAESKAAAFVEKYSKLQNEVHTLREEVYNSRASRAEFSKTVLQEARMHLEALQHSLGHNHAREDPETTRVLESLMADNETLKRDIAELQNLLLESRDDVRTLRDELEERRALMPAADDITTVATPTIPPYLRSPAYGSTRSHLSSDTMVSGSSIQFELPHNAAQHASPLTLPTNPLHHRRSLSGNTRQSGDDSIAQRRDHQHISSLSPAIPNSPSRHNRDIDIDCQRTPSPFFLDRHRTDALSSSRSRGVQTDMPFLSTQGVERDGLPIDRQEIRSETSSVSQPQDARIQSIVSVIIERVTGCLVKMVQADARTLTNRLKRQHLLPPGGDARHLSHSTISNIVNEVANLRPPGTSSDDVASSLTATRGDIKALLKLFKDTFIELGVLREQINEVIFDPAMAHKLRKEALEIDLVKGEQRSTSAMGGWIGPIQKLFTSQSAPLSPAAFVGRSRPNPDMGPGKPPPRVVPKLAPAISASPTTVKVEFASSGVRRTDTSDGASRVPSSTNISPESHLDVTGLAPLRRPVALPPSSSRNLMGIFAGAPQSVANSPLGVQKWEVPPNFGDHDGVRHRSSATSRSREPRAVNLSAGTIGRSAIMPISRRLSRNVDAVIDQNDNQIPDFHRTLLERTLRPRGLSDSSIHTTYLQEETESTPEKLAEQDSDLLRGAPTDISSSLSTAGSQPCSPPRIVARRYPIAERDSARSSAARLGRHLTSWATAATGRPFNDDVDPPEELLFGSPREDRKLYHAAWARREIDGRDI